MSGGKYDRFQQNVAVSEVGANLFVAEPRRMPEARLFSTSYWSEPKHNGSAETPLCLSSSASCRAVHAPLASARVRVLASAILKPLLLRLVLGSADACTENVPLATAGPGDSPPRIPLPAVAALREPFAPFAPRAV